MTMWRISSVLIGILLLVTACSATNSDHAYTNQLEGAVLSPPREIEDFTLMSSDGDEFTLSEHRGEVVLLFFGYGTCPDFCPTTLAELRRVYAELDEPVERTKIVFITVDPERDSLETIGRYTDIFHEDFIGLRPELEDLDGLLEQFGVVAEKRFLGESEFAYLVDHTATLFLINPQGQLEVQYLYGTPYGNIVHDVNLILGTS